jgi:anti-sigma regulatory factor (Ser/Thr protein kinase)
MENIITFNTDNKQYWIKEVNSLCNEQFVVRQGKKTVIFVLFGPLIRYTDFAPIHIVLLANLFEHLDRMNYNIQVRTSDNNLVDFFVIDLKLGDYFSSANKKSHIASSKSHVLNLWRVKQGEEKVYSDSVTDYFKRNFFVGYDLSGFQTALDEVYSNVADHSKSNGKAFSFIDYDEKARIIHIAACDFGLGIPTTLRNANKGQYFSDMDALRNSLEIGVTARSNSHNRGFGLDNVVSNLAHNDTLRIVSNRALLFCKSNKNPIKCYALDFDFKGTLIYFDICIDAFQKEENLLDIVIG